MLLKRCKSSYDIIVIGGGHAGVEASNISSRMGMRTLLVTLNFSMVANMPCNPSIGGSAKGIVVREIDALGGVMGRIADMKGSLLQMKVLNTSKGPGVRCLRAQEDKRGYPRNVQNYLKTVENLDIIEDECLELLVDENKCHGVVLSNNGRIEGKAVILATGTHMKARILRGDVVKEEGPDGEKSVSSLSPFLRKIGLKTVRLKTGTPPRIDPSSIDYSTMETERGTPGDNAFSYDTTEFVKNEDMIECHLCYTNEKTHDIIRSNLNLSAMFSGLIEGRGPRYCPSIEDKVVRFADKKRHQLFLEKESLEFESIYLQGFSTSMPIEVQEEMVHSLKGLENARILKYAYAIEYDAISTSEFDRTLMTKKIENLYISGQIACTSGYEEAAALGLMAGINASLKIMGKEPFILSRDEAYIGVMIDDLVLKGTDEPYRLLSSRSEYRLLTRSDNADTRLIDRAYNIGSISKERYRRLKARIDLIQDTKNILSQRRAGNNERLKRKLEELGFPSPMHDETLLHILKRQNVTYSLLKESFDDLPSLSRDEMFKLETECKYEGYIAREKEMARRRKENEDMVLPLDIDYMSLSGLSMESREKLSRIKPRTLGEAMRLSSVHPSDIDALSFYVRRKYQRREP